MLVLEDTTRWEIDWAFRQYDADMEAYLRRQLGRDPQGADYEAARLSPVGLFEVPKNLITTAGVARMHGLITGVGGLQAATATATRIGVGDGVGTAAVGDTDLSASAGGTHRQFAILDGGFPTAGSVMTFQATFASGVANFLWNEAGIDIGTPTVSAGTTVAACLLNHKTGLNLFTKTSSLAVVATATITIS